MRLKKVLIGILSLGVIIGLVTLSLSSEIIPTTSTSSSVQTNTNTSIIKEQTSLTRSERRTRNAAVKVSSSSRYGSGTYVEINGKHMVFTAAHVIRERTEMNIIGRNGEVVAGRVIYMNKFNDFAVLSVPRMATRIPVQISPTKKTNQDLVGTDIVYTGFPNSSDLVTINGRVAGIDPSTDRLVLHSYAWMGASGSGVFDMQGKFVGVLVAVSVGRYAVPQIIEDIVLIVPVNILDMESVFNAIDDAEIIKGE